MKQHELVRADTSPPPLPSRTSARHIPLGYQISQHFLVTFMSGKGEKEKGGGEREALPPLFPTFPCATDCVAAQDGLG